MQEQEQRSKNNDPSKHSPPVLLHVNNHIKVLHRHQEQHQHHQEQHQHHHQFAFVQECQHNHKDYYCCPSYTSPGGIRSLLFNQQQQQHTTTTTSSSSKAQHNKATTTATARQSSLHSSSQSQSQSPSSQSVLYKHITAGYLSYLIGDRHYKQNWDALGNSNCFIHSFQNQQNQQHQNLKQQQQKHRGKRDRSVQSSPLSFTTSSTSTSSTDNTPCHCCKSIEPTTLQNILQVIQHTIESSQHSAASFNMPSSQHPQLTSLLSFLAFENGTEDILPQQDVHTAGQQPQQQPQPQEKETTATTTTTAHATTKTKTQTLHKHTVSASTNDNGNGKVNGNDPSLHSSNNNTNGTNTNTNSATFEQATIVYHESAQSIVFRDHLRRAHDAQKNNTATTTAKLRSSGSSAYSGNTNSNGNGNGNGNGNRSSLKLNASTSDASSIATPTTTKGDSNSPILKNGNKFKDANGNVDAVSNATATAKTASFKDDVSIISNSSRVSHDISSYLGTTNHAVHVDSTASIASSLDGTHEQHEQHEQHDNDRDNVNENDNDNDNDNDHHSLSTMDVDDHSHSHSHHQHSTSHPHYDSRPEVIIANYTPEIDPLPPLDLAAHNEFSELLLSNPFTYARDTCSSGQGPEEAVPNQTVWESMSLMERNVAEMLLKQRCVIKTIKNCDLTSFIQKFPVLVDKDPKQKPKRWLHPVDFKDATKMERINKYREIDGSGDANGNNAKYHSFFTSVTLLPPLGLKMRCYGSTREYTAGIVFALPNSNSKDEDIDIAAERTHSWAWPSGYAAKTEFNISPSGELINGRKEALVSISRLRSNNHSYIYDRDYEVLGKMIEGGFHTLPYNELFCRVGGVGRSAIDEDIGRSFDEGLGLPVALFVRSATYGDLTALLRLRARLGAVLGKQSVRSIPLLLIDPDIGTRVLTENLQKKLLSTMSNSLNPFQNPHLKHKTQINAVSETHFQQKLEELLDLDDDNIRDVLTAEECARLAGGYGATDESVAHLLIDAMVEDHEEDAKHGNGDRFVVGDRIHHKLQNIVNEGLSAAVRSGDFNTSRQLLILYTLVASRCKQEKEKENESKYHALDDDSISVVSSHSKRGRDNRRLARQISSMSTHKDMDSKTLVRRPSSIPAPPPPPPLDTDRLRSATNSDGLLAVLGAAEVLKALQTGDAAKRALEAADSIEEWIEKSEHSVAFRLASWRDLTAAQGDLKIATESHSNLMAFLSNKAINNRTRFAAQLRHSVANTNFEGIDFLKEIHAILGTMHSPCLRLELLQFILGLDNRYSVAHVARSVELAATCLNISASDDIFAGEDLDDAYQ